MPNTSSASEPIAMPTAMAITTSSDGSFDDTTRNSTSSPTHGHSTRRHWCDSQGVATMTRATAEAISGDVGNDVRRELDDAVGVGVDAGDDALVGQELGEQLHGRAWPRPPANSSMSAGR